MDSDFKPIGTLIHGIAASEHLDSSGERISIRGLDVSSLERDGVFNHEHKNDVPDQIVGKILKAKKIFSEEDCETPEELYFWHKSQAPYLYVMGELFDGVGHKGAKEIAAMLKYDHIARQQNRPGLNVVNFSIEGSKLNKEGQEITRALARKVTITTAACNKVAVAELYDPAKFSKKEGILDFTKSEKLGVDMLKKNTKALKLPTTQSVSAKPSKILNPAMSGHNGVKKALTADSGLAAPSAKTGGAALVPESIEKDIQKLPNFAKFLKFIQSKYPGMSKNEAEAMAKYFTARAMIKAEEALEKMAGQDLDKSKNVREQRKKIFGTDANAPRLSDKRMKMMQQIRNFAERKFGLPMEIAEGKRDTSGQLREDKDNQPAYNVFSPEGVQKEKELLAQYKQKGIKRTDPKPDWRSGRLETQPSPDAAVHELAHLYLAPEGMNPADFQEHMDNLWGESQKKYGHLQQKKTSGEIQPMSVENPIRRELGLPANRSTKTAKQNEKALDYEGYRFVEGKDSKGRKAFYDRQSRLMTPETRERVQQVREGSLKFHPSVGWFKDTSPDSLINLRGRGQAEEAKARAQQRYSQQAAPKKLAASELAKGAARRIYGSIDPMKLPQRKAVAEWQQPLEHLKEIEPHYTQEMHQAARRAIPKMVDGLRMRALNRLANQTLTRKNPETGKTQYLLFRGVNQAEKKGTVGDKYVRHDDHSSWTPSIIAAGGFEHDYKSSKGPGHTIAAWIDEDRIHASPRMYGHVPVPKQNPYNVGVRVTEDSERGKNRFSGDHEIIVAPHISSKATDEDLRRYHSLYFQTDPYMRMTDPVKDIHGRINYRGERAKSGTRSTKLRPLVEETRPYSAPKVDDEE